MLKPFPYRENEGSRAFLSESFVKYPPIHCPCGPLLNKLFQITTWQIIIYEKHFCFTCMITNQSDKIWMVEPSKGFDLCMKLLNALEPSNCKPFNCHQKSWGYLCLVSGPKTPIAYAIARIKTSSGPHHILKCQRNPNVCEDCYFLSSRSHYFGLWTPLSSVDEQEYQS
ncbi:hypothetical protein OIU79_022479 [Salix purpurea]|uniref:Uncharacterized protein n=1 Tax=Salix purpurea TaxID=77065 RepID=A0A9Q0WGD7_SALPP|nr:hypothetical protein OIU79_022479 [Salix purpurea]